MSVCAIWIDRENAKLFYFSPEKMERKNLQARRVEHHTHAFDQFDVKRLEGQFFGQICEEVDEGANQLLILGPGVAKHHFFNYLTEHDPVLAKKVVGCETVDHPTDPQITDLAKKFFRLPTRVSVG